MGIYIPGVEMPENCIICDLSHEDGWCPAKQDYVDRYSFETCPLVPVPPHGRLGDLDALRQDWLENGENECVYDTNAFLGSLDDAPTIIPAEEGAPEQDGGDG